MFCYQCEQTAQGVGCTKSGVCGKDPQTAALQDLLVHALKGLGQYAHRARKYGVVDHEADVFTLKALFSTLTNVNFDPQRFEGYLARVVQLRNRVQDLYEQAATAAGATAETLTGPATWQPAPTLEGKLLQEKEIGTLRRKESYGDDIAGLQDLVLFGLKGLAAYADHAQILGQEDETVYAFVHEVLNFLAEDPDDLDTLVRMALKVGEVNLRVMELLDLANTGAYGDPEPTQVQVTPVKGKAILVSGHDLKDLEELLRQTEGTGINVYTHGEMLPALAYPGLTKYSHLVGNYGGAWQDQRKEFAAFPGPIVMTTNCLQKPQESYQGRIFTCGVVGWPGVTHLGEERDFSAVIRAAEEAEGFTDDAPEHLITIGFGHQALLAKAPALIEAVQSGALRHFFLIGGCDGAKPGRNYYTQLAEQVPDNCLILTLACGKYRFNKLNLGQIGPFPKVIDIGQCNDAYSAIKIAVALAEALRVGVNDLPLSLILSWFEQKAVVILLTLLHLGLRNIKLGPTLPAFITPSVLQVFADTFELAPISTPEEDLKAALGS
ncbi:MAG: hydroxylamine reductase [Candidatus Zipacnadales bacterium]